MRSVCLSLEETVYLILSPPVLWKYRWLFSQPLAAGKNTFPEEFWITSQVSDLKVVQSIPSSSFPQLPTDCIHSSPVTYLWQGEISLSKGGHRLARFVFYGKSFLHQLTTENLSFSKQCVSKHNHLPALNTFWILISSCLGGRKLYLGSLLKNIYICNFELCFS